MQIQYQNGIQGELKASLGNLLGHWLKIKDRRGWG